MQEMVMELTTLTDQYIEMFRRFSRKYNI